MPDAVQISIVIPTYNRLPRLTRCLDKIRQNVALAREVIVVDGGSTDGTRAFLADRPDLRVILEPRREGAVRAFNKGFRAARGTYVTWLNDDAYPLPGAYGSAVAMLERPDLADVGLVALYHNDRAVRNILDEVERDGVRYHICNVRGFPYANFGVLRRSLLERLGYADERYYFFAFDPDLALKVQLEAGLKVIGCRQAFVHHDEDHDERKLGDMSAGNEDNAKLFAKWNLPPKDSYPDPGPAYRALLAERGL
ncbi:MAG TPA: glycosyltransferase family 2 protein [Phycisphaerae bacterium]|nr:glycosyltransferase family 2 protein [Phycisphaerae bacterium]HNU45315.1 glycosyltransferase family 2 protein [Phycisphaerae bacterium]